ncbi:hypothetical protein [Pseudomonas sp. NPDC089569]|uniref:hypothetical protein n=1 Tax=Pseudomonas sp. NPDC089569 TaxID=3390722 RepID=UPI003CFD93DB
MGATVSTCKLVGAFRGSNGQPCYVMFEQTYSKNVYPHTPKWNAQCFGDLAATLKMIFASASSCEGGMLQGAGGRSITPEGYIAGWLKELENPVSMPDCLIELNVADKHYSPIAQGDFDRVKTVMQAMGKQDMVTELEAGNTIAVSLHRDNELLSEVFDGVHAGAWRVIPSYEIPVQGIRDASLGYKPQKAKVYDVTVPRFLKIHEGDSNILMQGADGRWRCAGWAYSIIAEYVTGLWQAELDEPGSYRARVKAYRNAVEAAASIPASGITVVVDTTVPLESYQQSNVEGVLKKIAHTRVGGEVHLCVPTDQDELYYVARLPSACTSWVMTGSEPTMGAPIVTAPMEQLSLLA